MAKAAVFWASGEGVAQCFGPERVEGNEGERLGSVERGVSGFGRGEQKRAVVAGEVALRGRRGARGRAERAPTRSNGRWRRFRATRGVLAGRRWRGGGSPEWWAARRHAGGAEQRTRPEVEEKGPVCNFQKF